MGACRKKPVAVTLKDVASAARVDIATASRSLSGKARPYRISEATEAHVKEIAKKLGYRPNRSAQSLRTDRTGLVGLILPDISGGYFTEIVRQVTAAAERHGFSVLLAMSSGKVDSERKLLDQMLDRQVEGVVVVPAGAESKHLLGLSKRRRHCVLVDPPFEQDDLVAVSSAVDMGFESVLNLLYDEGHRSVGVIHGLSDRLPIECLRRTLERVATSHAERCDRELVQHAADTEASSHAVARRLLSDRPEVTALIATGRRSARGALRAAREVGREVPRDLSLAVCGDDPGGTQLTTAAHDPEELGRAASTALFDLISTGRLPDQRRVTVAPQIHDRGSIQAPGKWMGETPAPVIVGAAHRDERSTSPVTTL